MVAPRRPHRVLAGYGRRRERSGPHGCAGWLQPPQPDQRSGQAARESRLVGGRQPASPTCPIETGSSTFTRFPVVGSSSPGDKSPISSSWSPSSLPTERGSRTPPTGSELINNWDMFVMSLEDGTERRITQHQRPGRRDQPLRQSGAALVTGWYPRPNLIEHCRQLRPAGIHRRRWKENRLHHGRGMNRTGSGRPTGEKSPTP